MARLSTLDRVPRRLVISVTAGVVLSLCACGSGSSKAAAPTTIAGATTTTIAAALLCPGSSETCTSDQVIATVEYIYERGGATAAEAACIALITATGKHAVNQAFEAFTDAQTAAAIACVGSEARARAIANASASWSAAHPNI